MNLSDSVTEDSSHDVLLDLLEIAIIICSQVIASVGCQHLGSLGKFTELFPLFYY